MKNFKFIDLFAGIGGFHHALSGLGGECVLTCEFDPYCEITYKSTFPNSQKNYKFVSNIREITRKDIENENSLRSKAEIDKIVPDHDVLCGGFPCQPFSKSGAQLGFKDKTRGTLFLDILQIIESKKPKIVFLENVRNIAGPRHTDTWATVIQSLQDLNYEVVQYPLIFSPHLLDPKSGGAPQVRERVFIIGVRADFSQGQLDALIEFNERLNNKKIWNPDHWKIADFLDEDSKITNAEAYYVNEDESMYLEAWDYFVQKYPSDTIPGHPIWAFAFHETPQLDINMPKWKRDFLIKNSSFYIENQKFLDAFLKKKWGERKLTVLDFPYSRQILEWQARKHHPKAEGRTLQDLVIQFRPSGIRVKPPTYLPALVAITQTSIVGPKLRKSAISYRKLTPIEAGRLQGIPDFVYQKAGIEDRHAYKQLGNAVNVGIVRAVMEVLLKRTSQKYSNKELQLRFNYSD